MDKKQIIRSIKAGLTLATCIVVVLAVVAILGSAVAWITGWSLVKGVLAIILVVLLSVGVQILTKSIQEAV